MNARGHSLIEMMTVIVIVAILGTIGMLKFSDYFKRYRTEAQTRMIYDELLKARSTSVYQRTPTRLKFSPNRVEIYSPIPENAGALPTVTYDLAFPITFSQTVQQVDIDERGLTFDMGCICIDATEGTGAVDSIVVGSLRTSIGKRNSGGKCDAENITRR